MLTSKKVLSRKRRQRSVRKRITGSDACPRLCVYRSSKHIYAQVISDGRGGTLLSASTLSKEAAGSEESKEVSEAKEVSEGRGVEAAKEVGLRIAKMCQDKQISRVVFDRNGFLFHGRVKALAEAAREAGLVF